jgi:hypothetical protein
VRARDIARDGEPQAAAAFVLIARIVETHEGAEHFVAHACRNPGAVVVHGDRHPAVIAMRRDVNCVAEPRRVGDEVLQAAHEGRRPHHHDWLAVELDLHFVPVALRRAFEIA